MRDVIKILAAGSLLSAYALIAPSLVEALPAAPAKAFTQRLSQIAGEAPVGAVASDLAGTTVPARRGTRPLFVALDGAL